VLLQAIAVMVRACLETRRGRAVGYFRRIQGGEAGESPKRALTAKPTLESAKITSAQRVAPILTLGGVLGEGRDHCGYRPSPKTPPTGQYRQQRDPLEFPDRL
jgi:hypothetical protein